MGSVSLEVQSYTVDSVSLQMFNKAKKGLELLPPTYNDLELHVERVNYKAKMWLQAEKGIISVTLSPHTWKKESGYLKP